MRVRVAADIESADNADVRRRSGSGELNRLGEVKMDRREVPREGVLARVAIGVSPLIDCQGSLRPDEYT